MSYLVSIGAKAVTLDALKSVPESERKNSIIWHSGFYAGLLAAEAITPEELDVLEKEMLSE